MRVFMGYDEREKIAYDIACRSLRRFWDIDPMPLDAERLAANGLLRRMQDRRGRIWDLPSNAPCSTDFAISRFLTPILAQTGWALFVDCDVVFLDDPRKMLIEADSTKAVQVVKHGKLMRGGLKMDGQEQTSYQRKNWSSVCLYNCDHPANRRLSLQDINERPGRDLHQFYWLADLEIGEVAPEWNWLVNVEPKPEAPRIAHFTNGGPFTTGWAGAEHDEIWHEAARANLKKAA